MSNTSTFVGLSLAFLLSSCGPKGGSDVAESPRSASPEASSESPVSNAPGTPETDPAGEVETAIDSDAAKAEPTKKQANSVPLPEGTKVLHVGDSFAGALGLPLGARLEEAGVKSVLKHTDASYLTTWAWEGDLQKYLWKYNPDLVIVTLGANELEIVKPEQRERTVKKIIDTIGDRPCLWVAIPLWKGKQNGLMDVIERSVGSCTFMNTNELIDVAKMPRISDGIHPTTAARAEWADFVIGWMKEHRDSKADKPWTFRP